MNTKDCTKLAILPQLFQNFVVLNHEIVQLNQQVLEYLQIWGEA